MSDDPLRAIEERLGHDFDDGTLLERALTHTSYAHEHEDAVSNERLEFLGDAVLQAGITILLFERFPGHPEGELSALRARLVREETLAELGTGLGLGRALRLGRGEEQTGGRRKVKLLSDATEAVLGALYLDAGFPRCREVVAALMAEHLDALQAVAAEVGEHAWKNPKSRLQEAAQERWRETPYYEVVRGEGPDHAPTFEAEARLAGRTLGRGVAGSKKEAMRRAALDALATLEAPQESP